MVKCVICNKETEQITHQFSTRKYPYNLPFFAALYFKSDNNGQPIENYCSAKCSLIGHYPNKNIKIDKN